MMIEKQMRKGKSMSAAMPEIRELLDQLLDQPGERLRVKSALPMVGVAAEWDHASSVYPDTLRVPMSDGKIVKYRLDVEQPHPCFVKVMGLLEKLPVYGGPGTPGYKGRHEKREDDDEDRQKPRGSA